MRLSKVSLPGVSLDQILPVSQPEVCPNNGLTEISDPASESEICNRVFFFWFFLKDWDPTEAVALILYGRSVTK